MSAVLASKQTEGARDLQQPGTPGISVVHFKRGIMIGTEAKVNTHIPTNANLITIMSTVRKREEKVTQQEIPANN